MPVTARPHYLTVEGKPLCQCEGRLGGLMDTLKISCGYPSRAAALRSKKLLQVKRHSIRLVAGHCPAVR